MSKTAMMSGVVTTGYVRREVRRSDAAISYTGMDGTTGKPFAVIRISRMSPTADVCLHIERDDVAWADLDDSLFVANIRDLLDGAVFQLLDADTL